nr:hypothetical protein [Parabacteroides goldsteinii]
MNINSMSGIVFIGYSSIKEAYNVADEKTKPVIEALFGKEAVKPLRPEDVRERVKSYEDACEELGIPVVTDWGDMKIDEIAYAKLKTIVWALNEGWVPDWEDSDQYKYWAWFDMSDLNQWYSRVVARSCSYSYTNGGVACASCSNASADTSSNYGSRLALKSRDLAIYCGNTFASLWAEYLLIL